MDVEEQAPETLAAVLRRFRDVYDLSQRDLAERLGYSVSIVRKLERGERPPAMASIPRLAALLDRPEAEVAQLVREARQAYQEQRNALQLQADGAMTPPAAAPEPASIAPAAPTPPSSAPRRQWLDRRSLGLLACALLAVTLLLALRPAPAASPPIPPPTAERLAAAARSALDEQASGELAALLAIRSLRLGYTPEADAALMAALERPLLRQVIAGHREEVGGLAFAPDGRTLLSGSWDGTARLWDVATGQQLRALLGHGDDVEGVAFSPDGRTAITGSDDGTARIWEVGSGTTRLVLRGHRGPVYGVAFAPDGRTALTGSADGTARLWDAATGRELRQFVGHGDVVVAVAFAPDGRRIVTASLDHTARIWDVATGRELLRLSGHTDAVIGAAFSPDGRQVLTGSWDTSARLWDAETGRELLRLNGHTSKVYLVAFAPDGRSAFSAAADGTARRWDLATGRELTRYGGHNADVLSVAVSPDGKTLATGDGRGTLRIWDVAPPLEGATLAFDHALAVWALDGDAALARNSDGQLIRWRAGGATPIDGAWPFVVPFHDGLLTGEPSGGLALRASDGSLIRRVADSPTQGPLVALNAAGSVVAAVRTQGVALWDSGSETWFGQIRDMPGAPQYARLSSDGHILAVEGSRGSILYRTQTQQVVGRFAAPHVALSSDGARAALYGDDGRVRVVELATGREQLLLDTMGGAPRLVIFAPDGQSLLTLGATGVRVWSAASGQQLRYYEVKESAALSAAFSGDGRRLTIASSDGVLRRRPVALDDMIAMACAVLPRDLSAAERAHDGIDATSTCA